MFQILPHTGDVRIKLTGSDLADLFSSGLEAVVAILKPGACNGPFTIEESISITSPDETALLVDFLSEVVRLSSEKRTIFCGVHFQNLNNTSVDAIIQGIPVESFDEDIKAVTYHEANIVKNTDGRFETVIVLDI